MIVLGGLLTACSGGQIDQLAAADSRGFDEHVRDPWEQPVPKATCDAHSRPERALQGQVPLTDRLNGRSLEGYSCNLELVGQYQGEGASWQHAWYDECAYYGTANNAEQQNRGVAVLDVSNPRHPVATDFLVEPAMLDPWESLKVNEARGLLAGVENGGPGFAVYDLKDDCTHPELQSNNVLEGVAGHEGFWSPDGMTYWGSDIGEAAGTGFYYPIDVADPTNPEMLINWPNPSGTHGGSLSDDGTVGYFVLLTVEPAVTAEARGLSNGLIILDTSDIQNRVPDPEIHIISQTTWEDGSAAQHTIPVTIGGHPYLIFVDELGSGGIATNGGWSYACAAGLPPYGFARIFDIANLESPKLVSKVMLETHDPANCATVIQDTNGQGIFGYDTHYCSVDRQEEPRLLACGYFNSGLRVFDIRDPYRPREIAYYNPPAQLLKQNQLPGSNHLGVKNTDWATAQVRFVMEREELWFTSQDNGFQVVRFTTPIRELLGPAP